MHKAPLAKQMSEVVLEHGVYVLLPAAWSVTSSGKDANDFYKALTSPSYYTRHAHTLTFVLLLRPPQPIFRTSRHNCRVYGYVIMKCAGCPKPVPEAIPGMLNSQTSTKVHMGQMV